MIFWRESSRWLRLAWPYRQCGRPFETSDGLALMKFPIETPDGIGPISVDNCFISHCIDITNSNPES